jgi:hypothetical protein
MSFRYDTDNLYKEFKDAKKQRYCIITTHWFR